MIDIRVNLCEITTKVLSIGLEGEQNHVRIVFDAAPVLEDCPEAIPSLAVKAPSGVIYPKVVTKDGTSVYWVVSASDCAQDGTGNYQLTFINDEEVIKTFVGAFRVYNSLTTNGPAPDPIQQWIDEANEALGTISGAVERAENAATASETAQGKAEDAQTAAETAQGLAEAAEEAAEVAEAGAETAQGKAEDAQAAAESARDTAEGYVTEAQGYASDAQGYADNAAGSAETAGDKAQEASGYADNASGYASDAQGYASAASGYADSASGYATQASGYADDASDYATTAGNKATEAGQSATAAAGSATTAGNKATEAGQSSSSASASALKAEGFAVGQQNGTDVTSDSPYYENNAKYYSEQAEQSAEDAEQTVVEVTNKLNGKAPVVIENASGSIATFTDGADGMPMSVVASVEPVQDLHGQANPYPPGGGKNLLDPSLLKDQSSWNVITLQLKPNTTYCMSTNSDVLALPIYFIIDDEAQGSSTKVTASHPVVRTTGEVVNAKVIQRRSSGDDSFANYKYQLEEGSTATAWSPYSNICPISGWTGATVFHSIVNASNAIKGRYINASGQIATSSGIDENILRLSDYVQIKAGTSYTLKAKKVAATNTVSVAWFTDIDAFLSRSEAYTPSTSEASYEYTVTAPGNAKYCRINFFTSDLKSVTFMPTVCNSTISITFPSSAGTVYGGTLTVNDDGTGSLVVDMAYVEIVGSNITTVSTTSAGIKCGEGKLSVPGKSNLNKYCNVYVPSTSGLKNNAIRTNGTNLYIYDNRFTDLETARTILNGTPVQFAYEIETPITYNLTDLDVIGTLKGLNNVWADTGDVSADYPADTKAYIAKELSATQQLLELIVTANREDSMTATKAYSTGNLLIVNGMLYRATTSIANGATLTVGTNVAATTIAAELAALA